MTETTDLPARAHDDTGSTSPLPRPIGFRIWLAIGAAAAIVGLLPWIITGMRLPLQNLWGSATLPGEMPISLLPHSQYEITLVAALIITGAAIAGVVGRATRPRQGRRGFVALALGVLVVQLLAIVQSVTVVATGLRGGIESIIYLAAIIAVATLSFLIGAAILVLIARAPRAGALIGLSIASLTLSWWVGAIVVPEPGLAGFVQFVLLDLLRWLPAVLCGIAIAWCGIRSVGRIIAAVAALAIVTVGPALATAITSATGMRVLARYPTEMIDFGAQVFRSSLGQAELTLPPIVTTIVVAAVGLVIVAVLRRRAPSA